MATLTGQTIASSYEQLLSLPDGGGNGTNLVAITDGDGVNTFALQLATDKIQVNGNATITTADNTDTLSLISTDEDANVAPNLSMYRNSASPAVSDQLGQIQFVGRNNNSQDVDYAVIGSQIIDVTDGTEDGRVFINSMVNGALQSRLDIRPTETIINNESIDLDFRIESDANTHALFLEGSTGNIGIGTSTPSSFDSEANNLVVGNGSGDNGITIFTGSSAGNYGSIFFGDATGTPKQGQIRYEQNNEVMSFHTNTAERMRIDLNGNVGIGTASPDFKLSIEGTGDTIANIDTYSDTTTNTPVFKLRKSNNDTLGTISPTDTNHYLGFLGFEGVNSSSAFSRGAYITAIQTGGSGSTYVPAKLQFGVSSNSASLTSMTLDENSRISLSNNDGSGTSTVFGSLAGRDLAADGNYNTFVGDSAGLQNKLGINNVALGHNAMDDSYASDATDAGNDNNIFIGHNSGGGTWTGSAIGHACHSNVGIGTGVMSGSMEGANNNTAVGLVSTSALTTGDFNTGIGAYSNYLVTTGGENTALGYSSGLYNATGSQNVYVGAFSGQGNSGDSHTANVGLGYKTLYSITTGGYNVAIGYQAGDALTTSAGNVFIGSSAGSACVDTANAVLIGNGAGEDSDIASDGTIAIGYQALKALSSGGENLALGYQAMTAMTTGAANIAIGHSAMDGLYHADADANIALGNGALGGAGNVALHSCVAIGHNAMDAAATAGAVGSIAIGRDALGAITSGEKNTAIGFEALAVEDDGDRNTAVGFQALTQQTGSSGEVGNTSVGYRSGYSVTSGVKNTIVGSETGDALTTGDFNVAIGQHALGSDDTGNKTVAIGTESLYHQASDADEDTENTAIGYAAGYTNVLGKSNTYAGFKAGYGGSGNESFNTGIGRNSLVAITSGPQNTAVGNNSGEAITSGGQNTTLGDNAGDTLSTGSYNTIVGGSADVSASGSANQTVLGYGVTSQGDNSVTLGNDSVTAVYMAQDSGATVHCSGVNFPDGTSHYSSDVNTLDDYEEGEFNFSVAAGTNTIGLNASSDRGSYVKIGSLVTVQAYVNNNSFSSASGTITFSGLPFASNSALTENADRTIGMIQFNGSGADGLYAGYIADGTQTMIVQGLTADQLDADVDIFINATYRVV